MTEHQLDQIEAVCVCVRVYALIWVSSITGGSPSHSSLCCHDISYLFNHMLLLDWSHYHLLILKNILRIWFIRDTLDSSLTGLSHSLPSLVYFLCWHVSCLLFLLSSSRVWKQQYERWHVQCWLPLHHQHRLLLSVHQYNECQVQRLPGYDLASDGCAPALLPWCILWCHPREGHAGRHHGEGEDTLGSVPPDHLFHSPSTHRGMGKNLEILTRAEYFVNWNPGT